MRSSYCSRVVGMTPSLLGSHDFTLQTTDSSFAASQSSPSKRNTCVCWLTGVTGSHPRWSSHVTCRAVLTTVHEVHLIFNGPPSYPIAVRFSALPAFLIAKVLAIRTRPCRPWNQYFYFATMSPLVVHPRLRQAFASHELPTNLTGSRTTRKAKRRLRSTVSSPCSDAVQVAVVSCPRTKPVVGISICLMLNTVCLEV